MKKLFGILAILMVSVLISCGNENKSELMPASPTSLSETSEPTEEDVYQPKHQSIRIDLKTAKRCDYRVIPKSDPVTSVVVHYDPSKPYSAPIEVIFTYENGDTYSYIIPKAYGLWQEKSGKFYALVDNEGTVILQGQERNGKFHEFVFFGNTQSKCTGIEKNSCRFVQAGKVYPRKGITSYEIAKFRHNLTRKHVS